MRFDSALLGKNILLVGNSEMKRNSAIYFSLKDTAPRIIRFDVPVAGFDETIFYISRIGETAPLPDKLIDELNLIEEENLRRFLSEVSHFKRNGFGSFFVPIEEDFAHEDLKEQTIYKMVAKNRKDALMVDREGFLGVIPFAFLSDRRLFKRLENRWAV